MVFKSALCGFTVSVHGILAVSSLLAVITPDAYFEGDSIYVKYLLFLPFAIYLWWTLLQTEYEVDGKLLLYRSGPHRGRINIDAITKIEYDHSLSKHTSNKPALSNYGLTIYYEEYDAIFISPHDRKGFVSAVVKVNPKIEVINKKERQ